MGKWHLLLRFLLLVMAFAYLRQKEVLLHMFFEEVDICNASYAHAQV